MDRNRWVGRTPVIAVFIASLMLLAWASMMATPPSRADSQDEALNALMMGGSGMPTPGVAWRDAIITDYIEPATGHAYTSVLVPTPESFASTSVADGLAALQAAMAGQQIDHPDQPFLVEGYSQSAVIAIDEKTRLIELAAAGQPAPDVTFLLLGSLNRPDGGLFARFPGLVLPGTAGFDFNGAEPTDAGIPTIDIANQYDFFADFPQYPTNLVADLNAVFGSLYAHAAYGDGTIPGNPAIWPPSAPLAEPFADHYVLGSSEIVRQVTGDTTLYFIPATTLPLLGPLHSLGVPQPVLNIVQPALQVIIEAGYDRSTPFGDPTPAQPIPTLDPVTFTIEFIKAIVQGANNATELFGAQLSGATELESLLDAAQTWSAQDIGVPYDRAVSAINEDFNPFTTFAELEGPVGREFENLLELTGIQQGLLDPVLDLLGPLGGMFTS